ncbi:MAG TPA: hypothetical protein VLZ50_04085 [Terracidiphilus sp.]|nr:hypothetical protein [Terracidiphilus sp.]
MSEEKLGNPPLRTPAGFTPRTGGLASEYAREMGWGLNEPERATEAQEKHNSDRGTGNDYGAADFGDTAKDTSDAGQAVKNEAKPPVASERKPPIIIVKPDAKPTPKTEQKPKKRIA